MVLPRKAISLKTVALVFDIRISFEKLHHQQVITEIKKKLIKFRIFNEIDISEPEENIVNIKPIDIFMTLGDLIRTDRCFEAISVQMVDFMTRTDQRTQAEANILELLTCAVNLFDPLLKVLPFGSVEYTFSGTNTNYNIFIDTRK